MDIWNVLGIARTTDIRQIKGAYARQARQYHPEDHPEQFRLLQKAYKAALQYARNGGRTGTAHIQSGDLGREPEAHTQPMDCRTEPEARMQPADRRPEPESGQSPVVLPRDVPSAASSSAPAGAGTGEEREFDFSGIDADGEKNSFFVQFHLIVCNPCLINNRIAWNLFLNRPKCQKLFQEPAFREEFVRTLCGLHGFRRDTLLLFEQYLKQFHQEQEGQRGRRRETDLPCFLKMKWLQTRMAAFDSERFKGKEGMAFQNMVMARFRRQERMIDLGRRRDVEDYMQVYFAFAASNEEKLYRLYRKRKYARLRSVVLCLLILSLSFTAILGGGLLQGRAARRAEEAYREEIRSQQEKQAPAIRTRAEKEIDRILEKY